MALIGVLRVLLTAKKRYQGPGDVFPGAVVWYSSARAYNAAYAAARSPAMDLVDQAGANAITINILPTGFVDVASINAWVTAHTVTTICVTRVYDQTGNGHHAVQVTLANMPTLTLNAIGTLPAITNVVSPTLRFDSATAITLAQPLTMMAVSKRSGTGLGQGAVIGNSSTSTPYIGQHSNTQVEISACTTQDITLGSAIAWNGYSVLFNGASSFSNINGVDAAVASSPGAGGFSAQSVRFMQGGGTYSGQVTEAGIWPTSAPTDRGALYANQQGSSGYSGAF